MQHSNPKEDLRRLARSAHAALREAVSEARAGFARTTKPSAPEPVVPPVPPPWDAVWREHDDNTRKYGLSLLGCFPYFCALACVTEWILRGSSFGLYLMFPYVVLMSYYGQKAIGFPCPRCGHRFNRGRQMRNACQHCQLPYGQRE